MAAVMTVGEKRERKRTDSSSLDSRERAFDTDSCRYHIYGRVFIDVEIKLATAITQW